MTPKRAILTRKVGIDRGAAVPPLTGNWVCSDHLSPGMTRCLAHLHTDSRTFRSWIGKDERCPGRDLYITRLEDRHIGRELWRALALVCTIWPHLISSSFLSCSTLLKQSDKAVDDYEPLRLPKTLIDKVDRLVSRKMLGFRSRAEFVTDAIRLRLEASSR